MQYIQGTPHNQLLVISLEEKITTDNPVRFIEILLEVSCISLKSFVDKPIMLKKTPEASVQQGFHCSCFARNENLAIVRCFFECNQN